MRQLVTVSGTCYFAIILCCSSSNGIWFCIVWVKSKELVLIVFTQAYFFIMDTWSTDLDCVSFRKELYLAPIACHAIAHM